MILASCCPVRPRVFAADAGPSRRVDPTGTTTTRRRLEADLVRRITRVRRQVLQAVGELDVLGLRREADPLKSLQSAMFARMFASVSVRATVDAAPARLAFAHSGSADKVQGFSRWLGDLLDQEVLGVTPGTRSLSSWTGRYVDAAFRRGGDGAARLAGFVSSGPSEDRLGLMRARTAQDLDAIAQAVSLGVARALTQGLTEGAGASVLARRLVSVIDKIGMVRARVLARVAVVAAHAEGALSAYEEAGVERVTAEIERVPRRLVQDAFDPSKHPRDPGGESGGEFVSAGGDVGDPTRVHIEADPAFIYHATNVDNLRDIVEAGVLKNFGPSHGTDQSEWPDGSREKRSYFTHDPQIARNFYPVDGKPVLLRVRRDVVASRSERGTGDLFVNKTIRASRLEVLTSSGSWRSIVSGTADAKPPPVLGVRLGAKGRGVLREHPESAEFRPSGLRGKAGSEVVFATAGDDDVCPQCEALEGEIYTVRAARGVIPVHPNCRCQWVPA